MLKAGQPSEALSLLSEDPKLAWIKDPESGGYAIHIAAWKVRSPRGWKEQQGAGLVANPLLAS